MVTIGVMVDRALGSLAERWAEALSGVLLIGIGSMILYENLTSLT